MQINMDKEFGNNIGRLRTSKHYTQTDMEEKLQLDGINISRSTYAKIELGIRNVSLEELRSIKKILGASWDDIFGE